MGFVTISAIFESLLTFFNFLNNYDLLNESNYRSSKFDLCNINLLNRNFCVAQDALDTKGFGTPKHRQIKEF